MPRQNKILTPRVEFALVCAFVAIEVVLYALFLAEDFGDASVGANVWLKYSTVIVAFGFALTYFVVCDKSELLDVVLLVSGLALTLVSDYFLLVKGEYYEVGLVTFIGAQLCYFARIKRGRIWLVASISARIILSVVAIIVLKVTGYGEALYLLVAVYFVQLVGNFVENVVGIFAAKEKDEKIKAILLSVGFLLFIGCDISVGLMNLFGEAGECIWLFYTPSQVLIALSHRRKYEDETN